MEGEREALGRDLEGGESVTPAHYLRGQRSLGFDTRPKVAVIYVVGDIVPGRSQSGMFGDLAGSETVTKALHDAREDDSIKGDFQIEASLRYDRARQEAQTLGFARSFNNVSAALGVGYLLGGLKIGVNASRTGRAPAIEELFSDGPHIATQAYEIGDPTLNIWLGVKVLRKALVNASARSGRFEAWFTHMFVQSDLANDSTRSGEALILQADHLAKPQVLARLSIMA